LIRRETDRGVVCLVDQRFSSAAIRSYFPPEWRPIETPSRRLPRALEDFWNRVDPRCDNLPRDFPAAFS